MAEAISILNKSKGLDSLIFPIFLSVLGLNRRMDTEDYIIGMSRLIEQSRHKIYLAGYDQPFVDNEHSQQAFTQANRNGIILEAIIPEDVETYLDSLPYSENVKITRHPNKLVNGFMVMDDLHTAIWDSTCDSVNPFRRNKGHYFRFYRYGNPFIAEQAIKYFDILKEEVTKH